MCRCNPIHSPPDVGMVVQRQNPSKPHTSSSILDFGIENEAAATYIAAVRRSYDMTMCESPESHPVGWVESDKKENASFIE